MHQKVHVQYKVQPQKDGTFVILQKDSGNGRLTIHSVHDTFDEANDELASLKENPSQGEILNYFTNLKNRIKEL